MTHPGKKLLFMGQEFASFSEWNFNKELDWQLFNFEAHQKANDYFRHLAHLYKENDAFFKYDHDPKGFKWLVVDDHNQSVFSYTRMSDNDEYVIILNMTPNIHFNYELGVLHEGVYEEVLNSDHQRYYGSNLYNGLPLQTEKGVRNTQEQFIKVTMGPLSACILRRIK